jgi:hypothetical protein
MFRFNLLLDNGKSITENTKITVAKKPFVIKNFEDLAKYIYVKWKKQTGSKSFVEWCDAVNEDVNLGEGQQFTIECAVDHLAGAFTLALNKTSVDLFAFMCENLPELKKIGALEADDKDFFEVLFSNGAGVYNMLYVIEYAAKTGFKSDVTNVDDENLAEEAERAERHIQNLCAENIMFGCTGNGDYVFAHVDSDCWSC